MEFIYAQSPVYMKGLLLGCFFFMQGIAVVLGSLLILSQSKGNSKYWEHFKSFLAITHTKITAGGVKMKFMLDPALLLIL